LIELLVRFSFLLGPLVFCIILQIFLFMVEGFLFFIGKLVHGVIELAIEQEDTTEEQEEEILGIQVTTVVDNETTRADLGKVWGLGFYIEVLYPGRSEALLFDLGGSSQVFRHNAKALDIDFSKVRAIVISHYHNDHFGAIDAALDLVPKTELILHLPGPHETIEKTLRNMGVRTNILQDPQKVRDGIRTTGILQRKEVKEHSLVINTVTHGIILIMGCAHPKVLQMLDAAKQVFPNRPVHAVIGGFHLKTSEEGREVAKGLQDEGVQIVSPCHCTSEKAKSAIRAIVGEQGYRKNGSGTILDF
jgi:7,8-dihydropterin-6-yl-methyl-4-(beta-D-ribofuranosyl)aminobenzene 5'-phosphate synthase